jgi:hypothetical protein
MIASDEEGFRLPAIKETTKPKELAQVVEVLVLRFYPFKV